MSKSISANEVKDHNIVEKGLYIIIDNGVYEMAGFVDEHPGGAKILKRVGGKDASKQFWKVYTFFSAHTLRDWKMAVLVRLLTWCTTVSQRISTQEVPRPAEDWRSQGGSQTIDDAANVYMCLRCPIGRFTSMRLHEARKNH